MIRTALWNWHSDDLLREAGLQFEGKKKQRGTQLVGKTFVLTGMLPNLSRCGTHVRILRAVRRAAETMRPAATPATKRNES